MLIRALVGCLVVPAAVFVGASSAPSDATVTNKATGVGSVQFGKDLDAVAMFDFHVSADPLPRGSLLVAAEHHDEYPETIVLLDTIKKATFTEHQVRFSGTGTLNEQQVNIKVVAVDGVGSGSPDHFSVTVMTLTGQEVFQAEGDLTQGDIFVGEPQ